ncbi:hypothetical protein OG21DRAFT_575743 [Imleria badia]|nr:hypothetical protein OG21DRAFT_575743 [Imleria badia]
MQVLDFIFCILNSNGVLIVIWSQLTAIFQLVLVTVTCTLIFIQYARESSNVQNAKGVATKPLYKAILPRGSRILLSRAATCSHCGPQFLERRLGVAVTTLSLRFIMNIRELHARNIRGGHGNNIDSGFGFSTLSGRAGDMLEIMFAEAGRDPRLEQEQEMEMGELYINRSTKASDGLDMMQVLNTILPILTLVGSRPVYWIGIPWLCIPSLACPLPATSSLEEVNPTRGC